MNTLKVFLVIVIGMIGLNPAFSQREMKTSEERVEQRTSKIAEELNLTKEQAAKLAIINEKYAKERQSIATENRTQREENKKVMSQLNDAQNEEIKAILTPEQQEKMKAMKKEKIEKRRDSESNEHPRSKGKSTDKRR